jgi:hypothetical protein
MWLCGSPAGVGYLDGLKKFEFCQELGLVTRERRHLVFIGAL